MTATSILKPVFSGPTRALPQNAVLIIGAGHFGERAVRILEAGPEKPLVLIDHDQDRLEKINSPHVTRIRADGIQFLADHAALLNSSHRIIPAIPVHLALEWLKRRLDDKREPHSIKLLPIPNKIIPALPHTSEGRDGSLLVSYADFICPDDCPEPAETCTMTGKRRPKPLHELLAETQVPGFRNHVIVSRQLAPGVGGYEFSDLHQLLNKVRQTAKSKWLIATACKCHGVITAIATA